MDRYPPVNVVIDVEDPAFWHHVPGVPPWILQVFLYVSPMVGWYGFNFCFRWGLEERLGWLVSLQ